MDNIVSYWNFVSSIYKSFFMQPNPIDELFDKYCEGVHNYGPFWDHNLGYWKAKLGVWKASLEKPQNLLFMTYEDLKENINIQKKRLATFLGFPFSKQEEDEGVIEEVSRLCSLRNLKSLDVKKKGLNKLNLPVSAYLRKEMEEIFKNSKTSSSSSSSFSSSSSVLVKDQEEMNKKIDELIATLPVESEGSVPLYQFKGCWYPSFAIRGNIAADLHFQAQDSDILLASAPKSGTTWMKALVFSIVNRHRHPPNESPLLTTLSHNLIKYIEFRHYLNGNIPENLDQFPKPRLFATHSHYASLPHSIRHSSCRIVYVCRNPLDTFVSFFHFLRLYPKNQPDMDATYVKYCRGIIQFGPFWDNIMGYWQASLEKPEKVLFMKYEDLKEDIVFEMKRLEKFLGFPFSVEEENEGLVEEISSLCSFENLKNLEVNRSEKPTRPGGPPFNSFYRKGEVGDFVNHLNPCMVENLVTITQEKFAGSGLVFKYSVDNLHSK
ncbi:hypothetical protein FNV43_RR25342 [Rhamnella rubrinervis]|uniref:Sulfotransferase n=1 Tax=Rhamnella rubrinervis TaxID=2594499 RepID=A0A8K0DUD5_9ROSA|nr:hypothetical protein FNV43_RR25342 [Rhamnella rubrinervis]